MLLYPSLLSFSLPLLVLYKGSLLKSQHHLIHQKSIWIILNHLHSSVKNSLCFRKNRSYRDRGTFNRNLQHLEYYVHVHICMLSSHKSDRKMYYSFYLPKTCHGNTETCLIICIHSANQEMLAYGAANFFGSFFHCFPTAGSLSRSSLLADLNSHSQLPALIGTVFIVVCIGRKDGVK